MDPAMPLPGRGAGPQAHILCEFREKTPHKGMKLQSMVIFRPLAPDADLKRQEKALTAHAAPRGKDSDPPLLISELLDNLERCAFSSLLAGPIW